MDGTLYRLAIGGSFYHFSRKIATKARNYSEQKLINVFDQVPSTAWVQKDGVEVEIPIDQLNIKDVVVVNTGTMIPIDGVIIREEGMVDQRALTGESQPVEREVGGRVFAVPLSLQGRFSLKSKKLAKKPLWPKLTKS